MKLIRRVMVMVFFIAIIGLIFPSGQDCLAAGLADLTKIQVKVTTEAQVRSLLGEPKKVDSILKQKGSGRDFKERRDLLYNLDGKDVIIRINPKNNLVVKIIEM